MSQFNEAATYMVDFRGQDNISKPLRSAQKSVETFDKKVKDTQKSFRIARGGAAQFGMQIQDVAVQLQGGPQFMTVFAQQGSQMASLFGTGGAVIGAILAVSAALANTFIPQLLESKLSIEKVRKSIEDMRKVLSSAGSATDFTKLTSQIRELAEIDFSAAQLKFTALLAGAEKQLEGIPKQQKKAVSAFVLEQDRIIRSVERFGEQVDVGAELTQELANKYGITTESAKKLSDAAQAVHDGVAGTAEAFRVAAHEVIEAEKGNKDLKSTLLSVSATVAQLGADHALLTAQVKGGKEVQGDLRAAISAANPEIQAQTKHIEGLQLQFASLGDTDIDAMFRDAQAVFGGPLTQEVHDLIQSIANARAEMQSGIELEALKQSLKSRETLLRETYERQQQLISDNVSDQQAADALLLQLQARFNKDMEALQKPKKDKKSDLDRVIEGLRTEEEALQDSFNRRLTILANGLLANETSQNQYNESVQRLAEEHQERLAEIEARSPQAKQAEADEKRLEGIKTRLSTEKELLQLAHAEELEFLKSQKEQLNITEAEYFSQREKAVEEHERKLEDIRRKSAAWEERTAREKTEIILGELGNQFSGIASNNEKLFNLNKKIQTAQAIMNAFSGAGNALRDYPGPLGPIMAAAHLATGLGYVAQIKAQSFEGGGFTGSGSRSGGIDGRGGFAAILHPNESVIDHTKQNAGGVTIINNVDATGGGPDVDLKIQQAMAVTSQQTVATVKDLMSRGRF